MKIIFRTNGGKNIGLGHLYRCVSLAEALNENDKNNEIIFISNSETKRIIEENNFRFTESDKFDTEDSEKIKKFNPDIIIFDSYLADNEYLKILKRISKLIIFDDNNDIYDSSIPDIIINGNIHAHNLNYFNKKNHFLGPEYLILKKEYRNYKETATINNTEKSIMITTGGADFNRVMIKFVKSLKNLNLTKYIIIGPSYEEDYIKEIKKETDKSFKIIFKPKSLREYIEKSDFVITAAGSTVYEILTLKRVPIIYTLADNQKMIANELEKYGILNLGDYTGIDYSDLILKIENEFNLKKYELKKFFNLFDGNGAMRTAKKILGEIR